MELINEIDFISGGLTVKTWLDHQGTLYFQEIDCGCKSRTRRSGKPAGEFYDLLHEMGFEAIEN